MSDPKVTETKTIQCWPEGNGFTYQGDPQSARTHRRLKTAYGDAKRWRAGTTDEWYQILVNERANMYADRDVLACQSGLVDDLLKVGTIDGITYEDIENLHIDANGMDSDECKEWISENLSASEDVLTSEDLDELRDVVRDSATDREIMEWWLVTNWLCGQLRSIGECVIDNGRGQQWWGRTCTGQGFIMDGTLQRIAASFTSRDDVKGGR